MLGVAAIDTEAHAGRLGLVRAIAECLPGAGWQRCVVRLERDACSLLASRRHRAMADKALQAVFRETDPATVRSAHSSRRPRPTSSPTWTSPRSTGGAYAPTTCRSA